MDHRDSCFISVAENLSFSKAANDLHISQPAITRHIKELEERYKTTLFERKGNKIYLTTAGEKVYHAFKKISQQYRNLDFEIGQLHHNFSENLNWEPVQQSHNTLFPKLLHPFTNDIHRFKFTF